MLDCHKKIYKFFSKIISNPATNIGKGQVSTNLLCLKDSWVSLIYSAKAMQIIYLKQNSSGRRMDFAWIVQLFVIKMKIIKPNQPNHTAPSPLKAENTWKVFQEKHIAQLKHISPPLR